VNKENSKTVCKKPDKAVSDDQIEKDVKDHKVTDDDKAQIDYNNCVKKNDDAKKVCLTTPTSDDDADLDCRETPLMMFFKSWWYVFSPVFFVISFVLTFGIRWINMRNVTFIMGTLFIFHIEMIILNYVYKAHDYNAGGWLPKFLCFGVTFIVALLYPFYVSIWGGDG